MSIADVNSRVYDLAIVGGGAMGCALAWEAASRGLSTVLLEQSDFGDGTSANSLRIVHGGLRYLQRLDVGRARHSAAERSALLRIAPRLVRPMQCRVPTFPSVMRSRAIYAAGLLANDVLTADRNRGLAADHKIPRGGIASIASYKDAAPGIIADEITGAAYWFDAVIENPWRLCLAFALSAKEAGADIRNHTTVEKLVALTDHKALDVVIRDSLTREARTLRANAVADCRSLPGSSLLTQHAQPGAVLRAANVVFDKALTTTAVGFPARDAHGQADPGRLFFARPQGDKTAVGTWYFETTDCEAGLSKAQLDAILADINAATRWDLSRGDIDHLHVGFLPRKSTDAAEPIDRPRVGLDDPESGINYWRVQTEKWTTVRGVADTAVTAIAASIGRVAAPSQTRRQCLYGNSADIDAKLEAELAAAMPATWPAAAATRLQRLYGSNALLIVRRAADENSESCLLVDTASVSRAEIDYVLENEFPRTLADLIWRRLDLAEIGPAELDAVATLMAGRLGWSREEIDHNIAECSTRRHDKLV